MRYIFCFLAALLSQHAQAFSLFTYERTPETDFSRSEIKNIRLNAIFFSDETHWAFWLNEEKITPTDCPSHITLHQICQDWVDFDYHDKNYKLRINESFSPLSSDKH